MPPSASVQITIYTIYTILCPGCAGPAARGHQLHHVAVHDSLLPHLHQGLRQLPQPAVTPAGAYLLSIQYLQCPDIQTCVLLSTRPLLSSPVCPPAPPPSVKRPNSSYNTPPFPLLSPALPPQLPPTTFYLCLSGARGG